VNKIASFRLDADSALVKLLDQFSANRAAAKAKSVYDNVMKAKAVQDAARQAKAIESSAKSRVAMIARAIREANEKLHPQGNIGSQELTKAVPAVLPSESLEKERIAALRRAYAAKTPRKEFKPIPTTYPVNHVVDTFKHIVGTPPTPTVQLPPGKKPPLGDLQSLLITPKQGSVTPYEQGFITKTAALPPEVRSRLMVWLRKMFGMDNTSQAPGATPLGLPDVSSGYDRVSAMPVK